MAIAVTAVAAIVDGEVIPERDYPKRIPIQFPQLAGMLSGLPGSGDPAGPAWSFDIVIGTGKHARSVVVPLESFLTAAEYNRSLTEPISIYSLRGPTPTLDGDWLWLFRDYLYVTDRRPRNSELDEVVLKIKAKQYQRDAAMLRLKEQVANFEAVDRASAGAPGRAALADDVKLLVWSRDGARCVKCGATSELHFDHIIPWSRGGSDTAENIQLLCRTCNLTKGGRLV